MGMERIVGRWDQLDLMLNLLARSATGQHLSTYTNIITGPRRPGEADGPDELHVVILDNGRSDVLGTECQEILDCIRCGACLNVCPVYRQVGGHAYGWVYSGPIGAVLTPLLAHEPARGGRAGQRLDAVRRLHGRLPGQHPAAGPAARPAPPQRRRRRPGRAGRLEGLGAAWSRPLAYRASLKADRPRAAADAASRRWRPACGVGGAGARRRGPRPTRSGSVEGRRVEVMSTRGGTV